MAKWHLSLALLFTLVTIALLQTPHAQAAVPIAQRKVIIMAGIDSQGFDSSCSNNRAAGSVGALKNALIGTSGLTANDILVASWSGEYCDGTNRFQPKYDSNDTCDGAAQGSLYVSALVNRVLLENPNTHFTLIGHSLGGLAVSYWLSWQNVDFVTDQVDAVITLDSMVHDGQPTPPSFLADLAAVLGLAGSSACDQGTSQSWKDIRGEGTVVSSINNYDRTTRIAPLAHVNVRDGVGPVTVGDVLPGAWRDIELACCDHTDVWTENASHQFIRDVLQTTPVDSDNARVVQGSPWTTAENAGFIGTGALLSSDLFAGQTINHTFLGDRLTIVYDYDNPLAGTGVVGEARIDAGVWQALPELCDPTFSIGRPYGYRDSAKLDGDPFNRERNLCAADFYPGGGVHTLDLRTTCPFGCGGGSRFKLDALEVRALPATFAVTPVDVAFVIDTTGSMGDDIGAVKAAANQIITAFTATGQDVRLGIVLYKDSGDSYVTNTALPFTSDSAGARTAIDNISVGGGGDTPEAVFCALRYTIDGGAGAWRATPNKFIILMGDAPSHNPDFACSPEQTASSVTTAAINADPITIYAIPVGGIINDFTKVATGTGGNVFPASGADRVVSAILEAIQAILARPTADAGGPYSGNANDAILFDASGSFDNDGTIAQFEWDWDDDGTYDQATSSATLPHAFDEPYVGQVRLRVTDNESLSSEDTADVTIGPKKVPSISAELRLANLWLCNQGTALCENKESGVEEINFDVNLNGSIVGESKGETQALGSFEFEVRYNGRYVNVDVTAGELFDREFVTCATTHVQNAVQFRCVTEGKPADAPNRPGTLAVVHVTPTADVYSLLIANQENGIATQLINQDCQLSDLQGHPVEIDFDSCNDPVVTLRYLEGDIHADCIVDVLDQQQIAFRWGSRLGNLLYNSRMDLEPSAPKKGDGDIDAKDLQFVYGRHGSTCKDPHPPQEPSDLGQS